jgi:hypothetical protein
VAFFLSETQSNNAVQDFLDNSGPLPLTVNRLLRPCDFDCRSNSGSLAKFTAMCRAFPSRDLVEKIIRLVWASTLKGARNRDALQPKRSAAEKRRRTMEAP